MKVIPIIVRVRFAFMKGLSKIFSALGVLTFLLIGLIMFAKVPRPSFANTSSVSGKVTSVYSPCCNDIVITLQDNDTRYYINHGTEFLNLSRLNNLLMGKEVEMRQIDLKWHFWVRNLSPIAMIKTQDSTYYNVVTVF